MSVRGQLYGVAAVSASDAWAVGRTHAFRTLIMHWNGTTWTRVPSPSPSSDDNLTAVTAVTARSAWAVGYTDVGAYYQTLILRWNGTAWQRVPSPASAGGSQLDGVSAVSVGDAWAVGYAATPKVSKTLIGAGTARPGSGCRALIRPPAASSTA